MASEGTRNRVVVIGAIVGAVLGAVAGMVLLKRVEDQDRPALTASEGVSLGLLLLGLFRQLSQLGEDDKKKER